MRKAQSPIIQYPLSGGRHADKEPQTAVSIAALGAIPPELHREDATLDGPHLPDFIRVLHDLGDHRFDLVYFGDSV